MTKTRSMPAEWSPQSAVMLTWPHADTDWRDVLETVEPVFMAIARSVLQFESVLISCEDAARLDEITARLNADIAEHQLPGRVSGVVAPADDTWARDHGPLAVSGNDGVTLLDFRFNAWGNKFPHQRDNALNAKLAKAGAFGDTPLLSVDFVLEGGSVESDGQGTLLTTSECLLTPERNPSFDRTSVEALLMEVLGADRVLWLNHGYLAGDDTDSHIDTLARFCAPDHIAYVECNDPQDEHFEALQAMAEELHQFRQADGSAYRLTSLPWPDAIYDADGERLPATYANFLIINGAVLVPVYDVPQDAEALQILAEIFPDREIVAVPCRPLVAQHGSLHCVTMQLPEGVLP